MAAPLAKQVPKSGSYQLSRERKLEFIHLYRKLLREAGYLPDEQCRNHVQGRIKFQFSKWHLRSTVTTEKGRKVYPHPRRRPIRNEDVATTLHQEATRTLRDLKAANDGAMEPLKEILMEAYGRSGNLRKKMLIPYMSGEPPPDDASLSELVSNARDRPPLQVQEPLSPKITLSPALRKLAKAQASHPEGLVKVDVIKNVAPQVEKVLNSRGMPISLPRMENRKAKLQKHLISKILPPLAEQQWLHLKDLALGVLEWSDGVPRRTQARGFSQNDETPRSLERVRKSARYKSHQVTPRFMARRYMELLLQCPTIHQDSTTKSWSVIWYTPTCAIPKAEGSVLSHFPIPDVH